MFKKSIGKSILSLCLTAAMAGSLTACASGSAANTSQAPQTPQNQTAENIGDNTNKNPITIVWYPNESASDYEPAREEFGRIITEATGREVDHKLTTDYAIAIEAIASGSADICFMGAAGYIEAKNKNDDVGLLFVNSGASGTLDDAIYYSWLAVNKGEEDQYLDGDKFTIDNIVGKKISFVSNSSTSGFKVPTQYIMDYFSKEEVWEDIDIDDMVEGGVFFDEVLFGGSHQGSAFNLISGKSDIAAFCDTELNNYIDFVEGEEFMNGAVYAIKDDASAPFDTVQGQEYVVINSNPVLNGPFAYNPGNLGDDVAKIQEAFCSDEVAVNPQIFVIPDSGYVGMFKKTDAERFVMVDDSWYNPIRNID